MKPILYPAGETAFTNNGLGRLSEATKCLVTEERNGQYELEMEYPITGLHYKDICEERIIAAKHDDTDDVQPFRIYKITRPMNGIVTVYARHISYQLSKVTVMPFTANTCADALLGMLQNSEGDCPFTIWTDKLLEARFSVEQPASFRSLLGGVSGSILDVYGPGEYEWDRFTVKFHTQRGTDAAVMIRYGKNMTDVKKTTDTSNLWTGILPFWAGVDEAEQPVLVTLPERVIYSDAVNDFVYRMVVPVDLTGSFESQPTVEQLRSRAQSYVRNNAPTSIPSSIDVSFVALWQTEEYKDVAPLQKLKLCDTVTVYHRELGIENKAKIVSVTYDVILERYEKMTIGEVKTSLGDSIRQISEEIKKEVPTAASVSQAISLATNLLTGSQGGNIMINTNAQGLPVEILALNTPDITTATKILRLNKDGLSYSTTGYTGTYTTVLSMSGELAAELIKGVFDAALIKKGILADKTSNVTWNMVNGLFKGKIVEITTLSSTTINANKVTAAETDAGELTATTVEATSVEADAVSADTVSSGDGFTGTFYVPGTDSLPGRTITIRAGIVTGITEDTPVTPEEPEEPDPNEEGDGNE